MPIPDISPADAILDVIQRSIRCEVSELILPQFKGKNVRGLNLKFGLLYGNQPEAHVSTIGKTDCIGIELGFYSVMFDLMSRIFADCGCNIFPDGAVALASNIQSWSISNRPAVVHSHDSFVFTGMGTKDRLEHLLLHSHRFLFHHEMAHVWNGHLGLLESNQLEEVARKIDSSTDILRHCFELDADARAVHQTMTLITPCIYNDNRRFYTSFGLDNSPIERSIYQGVFVIYLTMRLLAFLSKTKDPSQTHPSALHRLTWAVELLFTNLTHKSNQYPPKIRQIIFSAVKICERGFCRITGELSIDIFQSDNLISSNEARDEILNSWEKLLPHLQDYKRGIVLPDVRRHGHDSNSVSQLYEFSQISARPASLRELFGLTVSSYSSRITYFWECLEIENFCIRDEHLLAFEAELFKLVPLLDPIIWNISHENTIKAWNDFIVVARRIINLVKIIGNFEKNEYWYNIFMANILSDRIIYYIDISCNEDNYDASNYLDLNKMFILKNSEHLIYYSSHLRNFNRDNSDIIIKYNCLDNDAENDFTLPRNVALIFNNFVLSLWIFFRMQPRDGN